MSKFFLKLKNKFWIRLFLRVGIIFLAFVLLVILCNSLFLKSYYEYVNKEDLKSVASELREIDLSSKREVVKVISDIEEEYGFETEIYLKDGSPLYLSSGGKIMDYFLQGEDKLFINNSPRLVIETVTFPDGSVFEKSIDRKNENEYWTYRFSIGDSCIGELRVQMAQIENSANIANRFISIIAAVFLIISLGWVFAFSKKVSKPISEMNDITKNMAALDFNKKLISASDDEIGQLAVSINNLSEKLNNTLQDLKASNAQLRNEIELEHQLDVMRRGFVANVSHELKTPISIIQGYAEGLRDDINTSSRDKYIDVIIDESHRMNKLVLSILNLSRYESGQIPLNFSDFNISDLIKARADRILNSKKVNIFYDMPDECIVYADIDQMDQVIKSYLENAASHVNDDGEIKVQVSEENENNYTVTVYNSGSFVDDEQMSQIWQSFYRGDKSHNRESGRFGLGLSIVSAIIKMHGESYGVYNTEKGVCFWFTVKKSLK